MKFYAANRLTMWKEGDEGRERNGITVKEKYENLKGKDGRTLADTDCVQALVH